MHNPFLRFLTLGLTPKPVLLTITPQRIVTEPAPLPLYNDAQWYGQTMTLPDGGIITRDSVIEPNHLSL
jgi:hypothetical protein